MSSIDVLTVALPFVWLGMVAAISFVETPLKFRAPGVTLAIGLGIGRVVFGALGRIEIVLVVAFALLLGVSGGGDSAGRAAFLVLCFLLVAQLFVVRPRLARRTDAVVAGAELPGSHLHLVFIALDVVKLVVLGTLGALLAGTLA